MVMPLPSETFHYKGAWWDRRPEQHYQAIIMGVDLGQSQDYTAVSVIHHQREPLGDWITDEKKHILRQRVSETFDVVGLRRLPLHTPYPDQVSIIQELLSRTPDADLIIDQTGPGAPVGDIFVQRGLKPIRIILTAGHEPTGYGRKFGVPKHLIVSGIDARLHTGQLRFAKDLTDGEALKDELKNFQRHVSAAGRAIFMGRASVHDDLVLSIGVALWWAMRRRGNRPRIAFAKGVMH